MLGLHFELVHYKGNLQLVLSKTNRIGVTIYNI